jgi:S-adenosylmethionine:tRNA ribosyltransferase-isomerase
LHAKLHFRWPSFSLPFLHSQVLSDARQPFWPTTNGQQPTTGFWPTTDDSYNPCVLVSDFHYDLPEERIAQQPLSDRASSRMLRLDRRTGNFQDLIFRDFPRLLRPGDLVVLNDTRVFPARLYGRRAGVKAQPVSPHNPASRDFLHGRIEVLLTRQLSPSPNDWECLVRPGRKIGVGELLFFGDHDQLRAEVLSRGAFGERRIRFASVDDFFPLLETFGHVPLPPYISRADVPGDHDRYQTIYARERGSVAAPTAGLHFTTEILDTLNQRGIEIARLTLHVGLGTFQPVRVQRVEDHHLHKESYSISAEAAVAINRALNENRRIVAVGTTTVRTLEYAIAQSPDARLAPQSGEVELFIVPGYTFRIVGALLTNFHLPESTLLMLVCAFAGRDPVLNAYRHAVQAGYRFYSYGDCMFLE